MFDQALDTRVRTAAFQWLDSLVRANGDVLPRTVLARGFELDGSRIHVIGPAGIWKPQVLELPLSITTAPDGPYDDAFGDKVLRYRYRGTNPEHGDNRGLRAAMVRNLPLVYFHGLLPGKYLAQYPVFVVGDHPNSLVFDVAVDDVRYTWSAADAELWASQEATAIRRAYVTAQVSVRVHQRAFRERVLEAYREQCSFCGLKHKELLEASHISPDSEPEGEPIISNGVALCSLHHKAFDRAFLGLRPDYTIEVRPDILIESDGPTLAHAIQGLHGARIKLPSKPSNQPDPERVLARYRRFQQSAEMVRSLSPQERQGLLW